MADLSPCKFAEQTSYWGLPMAAVQKLNQTRRISGSGSYHHTTTTATIKLGRGHLIGFHVNSASGGTLIFHDGVSAADPPITGLITPHPDWNWLPADFETGLHVVIRNDLDITVCYR